MGLSATADSLEHTPPVMELHDPAPAEARDAVQGLAAGRLDGDTVADLVLAVDEATTNALVHGRPPTRIRVWVDADRVVVHVRDRGPGPASPLAGLVPAHSVTGAGLGMWLTHQLDLDVALLRSAEGFTVRLRAGHLRELGRPTDAP